MPQVYPVVLPKVEYTLTPLGETLIDLLVATDDWAERYMAEILLERQRHDDGDTSLDRT
jgi:DNA-binding HxlR family transcriptional regulator